MILVGKTQAQVDAGIAEETKLAEIAELEKYLASTDWYAARLAETGKAIPEDVTTQRNATRERISGLRLLVVSA